tara:strand:+ start:181 stop:912 length:732 start_codon:yes stop_codon:yes gene_type:complete
MSDGSHRLSELFEWLRLHGVEIGSVCVGSGDGSERGVFATQPIARGDLLLAVPQSLMFVPTLSHASLSEGSSASSEAIEDALCVALIRERTLGDSSHWDPWLRTLPTPEQQLGPLLWSEQELEQLQCPHLRSQLRREAAALERCLQRLAPQLTAEMGAQSTRADLASNLAWAFNTVQSRAAHCPEAVGGMALVPLGDMFNHEASERASEARWDEEGASYRYCASVDIAQGEEVRIEKPGAKER